ILVLFGYKTVETCLCLKESGFERQLGPVVRMKVEVAVHYRRAARIEREGTRKCETTQCCGKQRRGGSLTAANEKVAAVAAGWSGIGGSGGSGIGGRMS